MFQTMHPEVSVAFVCYQIRYSISTFEKEY